MAFPGLFTIAPAEYWDVTYQVSGSDFTTTSTTPVDITGLSHAALANSLYEIEVHLVGGSSNTSGVGFGIAFSAAGATGTFTFYGHTTVTTGLIDSDTLGTDLGDVVWSTVGDNASRIFAGVKTGANAGNITVQTKKWTSGTATIYIGSALKIKKLA